MKTELIHVRIDTDSKKKLQKLADADHRNLSEFVRVQLLKLLETAKKK